ncbi:MAG: hypothetical protein CVU48_10275 [Candidatus Cloacimonetes bacterium HGW-Cloacimonetes-1]|nr:MAG: hypothetical protein CVU48_10275 [Candidatus Cloacimonetes bacterium HGW-Cloacimonetes-1]
MKAVNWIIIVILVITALYFGVTWKKSSDQNKALLLEKQELQTSYENATATISEIQSNLESLDKDLAGQLFTQKEIPGTTPEDRKSKITSSIANMKNQIASDKKRISELERKLAQSNNQLKGFQDLLTKLKTSVADKEKIISELQKRNGILTETIEAERKLSAIEIAERDKVIEIKQNVIEDQRKDINTVFYVIGTRKELIEKKIIDRKGGLLGIGKVSTVNKNVNLDQFSTVNLLDTQAINLPVSKKGYTVLSSQNAASYSIEKEDNTNVLKITDTNTFRKNKYVVIEIF